MILRDPAVSDLAVVIPTRGRPEILNRTLDALGAQTASGFQTVVVLDGFDQAAPSREAVTFLTQAHSGPGSARNLAVASTDRPLILFLGDDIVPRVDLVERHLEVHRRHPEVEVAVLGLTEWHPEVASNPHNRWLTWSGSQFDYSGIVGDDAGWGRFYSSNVSLKRDLFERAGGFDPDFAFDYEDLDLAYRLHQHGLRLLLSRQAVADHLHRYGWKDLVARYFSRGSAERQMATKNPWFEPWFARRLEQAAERPPRAALWVPVARAARFAPARLRSAAQRRADIWYHQHLMAPFFGAWKGQDDIEDLEAYLGDLFDPQGLIDHREWVRAEEEAAPDHETLYRTSSAYLYDLTAFATWGTKEPYRAVVRRLLPPPARLLDYGCGIGSDGLRFMAEGYDVAFADFDNPSVRYLRWRLGRRDEEAEIYDVEQSMPGGFDLVYSFDVIEHVDDPFDFLARLESKGALVMVNFLEDDPEEEHVHQRLPIARLIGHATRCGLLHYHRYEGRSHLVVYRSPGSGSPGTASGWASLLKGLIEIPTERLVPVS